MMKSVKWLILCLLVSMSAAADDFAPMGDAITSGAGIPTFDVAGAMNMARQINNDMVKINQLAGNLNYWKQQMAMMNGSRGMGILASIGMGAVRDLPESWGSVLQQVQTLSGTYGNMVKTITGQYGVLSSEKIGKMTTDQQAMLWRLRNLGATQKAIGEQVYGVAGKQLMEIQMLASQIDTASDPKAIADLTAAISAKKLELDNTRMKITALEQQVQAEQRLLEQQQREAVANLSGSSKDSRVSVRY